MKIANNFPLQWSIHPFTRHENRQWEWTKPPTPCQLYQTPTSIDRTVVRRLYAISSVSSLCVCVCICEYAFCHRSVFDRNIQPTPPPPPPEETIERWMNDEQQHRKHASSLILLSPLRLIWFENVTTTSELFCCSAWRVGGMRRTRQHGDRHVGLPHWIGLRVLDSLRHRFLSSWIVSLDGRKS